MAGNILKAAQNIYGQGTGSPPGTSAENVNNRNAKYEYGQIGRLGIDTNNNGIREVDCSALVYNGLRNAGYYIPGSSTAGFTTRTLFIGDNLTSIATENFSTVDNIETNLQPGDILLFKGASGNSNQHVAIFAGYDSQGQKTFYGSQTSTGPSIVTMPDSGGYWNGTGFTLTNALRPNESLYVAGMDLSGTPGAGLRMVCITPNSIG